MLKARYVKDAILMGVRPLYSSLADLKTRTDVLRGYL